MRALLLIDLQYDFMPGGALAVREGDAVVPVANRLLADLRGAGCELAVATQDWHPPGHRSFAAQHPGRSVGEVVDLDGLPQVLWPVHCVQGSHGAALHADLDQGRIERVFVKGTNPAIDSYSGFWDNGHRQSTGLGEWLRTRGVDAVDVLGLATDYCVKFTALDAAREGFAVRLHLAGCRAVDLAPGDGERAVEEMRRAGVQVM